MKRSQLITALVDQRLVRVMTPREEYGRVRGVREIEPPFGVPYLEVTIKTNKGQLIITDGDCVAPMG